MKIRWFESCGSTNEELKKDLLGQRTGSPLPPAIASLEQTGGKGRSGRLFSSPAGMGLYISIPLEIASVDEAMCIMPMASVCVCRAVEKISGVKCSIKWPNDVLCGERKLCGILTELVTESSRLYVVLGIGINLSQEENDFPEELRASAISLKQITRMIFSPAEMSEALLPFIEDMIKALPDSRAEYLEYYRTHCTTTGKEINITFSENSAPVKAKSLEISEDFGLLVQWENGSRQLLKNGEVSVRV